MRFVQVVLDVDGRWSDREESDPREESDRELRRDQDVDHGVEREDELLHDADAGANLHDAGANLHDEGANLHDEDAYQDDAHDADADATHEGSHDLPQNKHQ